MQSAAAVYFKLKKTLLENGIDNAAFEAEQMFLKVTGERHMLAANLPQAHSAQLQSMAARRAKGEPLQYILEEWDFLGLTLAVGRGVLIPRPETEEVCLKAACLAQGSTTPFVLDLCAGSGAIALGLQKNIADAKIVAVEVDPDAFAYLEKNIKKQSKHLPKLPRAVLADATEYYKCLKEKSVDLLVANPPYVSEAEYATLGKGLMFEPKRALVAEDNGLFFYKQIASKYFAAIKQGGHVVFEIGFMQGEAVEKILLACGYSWAKIHKDSFGNNRIAVAKKP